MKWFSFGSKKDKKSEAELSVFEVTDESFEVQVINRSYKMPVMVDFWAAWCGPCRQLGPTLEKLAEEADSPFVLAKANTEQNLKMAQKYGVRSIPAVKMFRNGRIADEFMGARPEFMVRRFVSKSVEGPAPADGFQGSDEPAKRLEQAQHQLKKGNGLNAFMLLNTFPESDEMETAVSLLPMARFMLDVADGDALTGVEALDSLYQQAARGLEKSNPQKALAALEKALNLGEKMDRPYVAEVMTAVFALLGDNHKLTKQYQAAVAAFQ